MNPRRNQRYKARRRRRASRAAWARFVKSGRDTLRTIHEEMREAIVDRQMRDMIHGVGPKLDLAPLDAALKSLDGHVYHQGQWYEYDPLPPMERAPFSLSEETQ